MKVSFRTWLSIITVVLIAVILYFSRHELVHAWGLLGQVDVWVLLLLIPVVAIGYLASGEMIFAYLRQKGYIKHVKPWMLMRLSLELNFVNHVLPSGGVSGISYVNWRMGKFGVSGSKSTIAQAVRYVAGFAAIATLLTLAVLVVTIDGTVNRWIILMSSTLVGLMVFATVAGIYLMKSMRRMHQFASWLTHTCNHMVRITTFGRIVSAVKEGVVSTFLTDMHEDYLELNRDRRVLIQPYLWGLFFTITEIAIFWIVFWSLGSPINPAPILIAYGLASLSGFLVVTPGGAGAYEAIMVLVLAIAGMPKGEAIAGIILTRAIILFTTIALGYIFYQLSLVKYGKKSAANL